MKLFDSVQGAFIKYHYFPRTHILTLQREFSHEYFKKKKKQKRRKNKTIVVPFQEHSPLGWGGLGWHQEYFDGRWAEHRAPCQGGCMNPRHLRDGWVLGHLPAWQRRLGSSICLVSHIDRKKQGKTKELPHSALGLMSPGFEFQPCHPPDVLPWVHCFPPPDRIFPSVKWAQDHLPSPRDTTRIKGGGHVQAHVILMFWHSHKENDWPTVPVSLGLRACPGHGTFSSNF